MKAREFLLSEKKNIIPGDPASDPLYSLKAQISHKIKDLPGTREVKAQLEEIQDILSHINLGKTKRGAAEEEFGSWNDTDVKAAKELLARYVISMNAPLDQKRKMIDIWKSPGGLINVEMLLGGSHSITEVVKGYGKNKAIQELADDLIMVDSMGKGKGEFMLKVLSPFITTPEKNKGDVFITGKGTLEVKTNFTNAAKFGDQEVAPGDGYHNLVSEFYTKFSKFWGIANQEPIEPQQQTPVQSPTAQAAPVQSPQQAQQAPIGQETPVGEARVAKPKAVKDPYAKALPASGINIDQLKLLYDKTPNDQRVDYIKLLTGILEQVFVKAPNYAKPIAHAIIDGRLGIAKQLYGVAGITNYMQFKDDIGVLFIDLKQQPAKFTFFKDNAGLNAGNLRLEISTAYPVAKKPREIYPPTKVVPTTQQQPTI
jgi:hypothetical protein